MADKLGVTRLDRGNVARQGPQNPLHGLQERLNELLEEFWERIGKQHTAVSGRAYHEIPGETDLSTDMKGLHLEIELPGMDEADIEVLVGDRDLTVRGEKRLEREVEGRTYYLSERVFGQFARTFALPPEVDPARIEARYRNGVLSITAPRKAGARSPGRKIEIQSS